MRRLRSLTAALLLVAACFEAAAAPTGVRKFDEFGNISCDDEKGRLDAFAIELESEPDGVGYVIFYGGRRVVYGGCRGRRCRLPRRGEAEARAARLKPYLVRMRGIAPERVVVVNGGYREEWRAVLFIVPKGFAPPAPTPTLKPGDIRFRKGRVNKGGHDCQEG